MFLLLAGFANDDLGASVFGRDHHLPLAIIIVVVQTIAGMALIHRALHVPVFQPLGKCLGTRDNSRATATTVTALFRSAAC